MKRIFTISLFSIVPVFGFGQVFVKGININSEKGVSVCEMLLLEDFVVNSNIEVAIDYGQKRSEFEGRITDPTGKAIKFNSAVAAINHMENNGWTLIDIHLSKREEEYSIGITSGENSHSIFPY